jgi:hypothetical protein
MLDIENHKQDIDDAIRFLKKQIPNAELYELGALLISAGCFLVASAIPELKPQLVPPANLAHQLLNQEHKDAETITSSTESLR